MKSIKDRWSIDLCMNVAGNVCRVSTYYVLSESFRDPFYTYLAPHSNSSWNTVIVSHTHLKTIPSLSRDACTTYHSASEFKNSWGVEKVRCGRTVFKYLKRFWLKVPGVFRHLATVIGKVSLSELLSDKRLCLIVSAFENKHWPTKHIHPDAGTDIPPTIITSWHLWKDRKSGLLSASCFDNLVGQEMELLFVWETTVLRTPSFPQSKRRCDQNSRQTF